jgi:hypothetical protein
MTKKDYILIAKVLKEARKLPIMIYETDKPQVNHDDLLATLLVTELRKDNPKFNEEKFLTACGLTK